MSCEKHLDHVKGWNGSLEELVVAIGNMRYDETIKFFQLLKDEFNRQAVGDRAGKRIKLANRLDSIVCCLKEIEGNMKKAWVICKPYMDK